MDGAEGRGEAPGPRAWVVLLGTLAAAVVVIGGVFGFLAWRDRDGGETAGAPSTLAAPATTESAELDGGENLLFRRTTDAGIEVRAQRNDGGGFDVVRGGIDGGGAVDLGTAPGSAPGGPEPTATPESVPGDSDDNGLPDFCDIVGDLTAWAISADSVVQGGGPITRAPTPELAPSVMWGGPQAGDSIIGVVMQVGDDVTLARVTGPGGAVDEMEPIEGMVVLAVPVSADVAVDPFSERGVRQLDVTAVHVDGHVSRAAHDVVTRGHPAWSGDPACMPEGAGRPFMEPPMPELSLPDAGAEQPADPAAARAEIEGTFSALYGSEQERRGLVDDGYGLEDVRQQIVDNGFGDAAAGSEVTITELVFTSAIEAAFMYDLTTPISQFPGQLGRARYLDGTWKITRATLCQDLSKAGVQCPP